MKLLFGELTEPCPCPSPDYDYQLDRLLQSCDSLKLAHQLSALSLPLRRLHWPSVASALCSWSGRHLTRTNHATALHLLLAICCAVLGGEKNNQYGDLWLDLHPVTLRHFSARAPQNGWYILSISACVYPRFFRHIAHFRFAYQLLCIHSSCAPELQTCALFTH